MVKHTQAMVHFVGLALKGLKENHLLHNRQTIRTFFGFDGVTVFSLLAIFG